MSLQVKEADLGVSDWIGRARRGRKAAGLFTAGGAAVRRSAPLAPEHLRAATRPLSTP